MSKASITYTVPGEGTVELSGESDFVLAANQAIVDFTFNRYVDREVAKGERTREEIIADMNRELQSELARIEREGPNEHATAAIKG